MRMVSKAQQRTSRLMFDPFLTPRSLRESGQGMLSSHVTFACQHRHVFLFAIDHHHITHTSAYRTNVFTISTTALARCRHPKPTDLNGHRLASLPPPISRQLTKPSHAVISAERDLHQESWCLFLFLSPSVPHRPPRSWPWSAGTFSRISRPALSA